MPEAAYLGLDLGGTGVKAGVFDRAGRLLGEGAVACAPSISPEGYAEIPIDAVYEAGRAAARCAIDASGAAIRAVAVSSQGQMFVSLDAEDRPLHPAILWYDSRAGEQAERLDARIRASGEPAPFPTVQSISTAPKIMWLRKRFPEVMARARRHLLLPDYFAYRLTGIAVVDRNTASSTGLYADDAPGYSQAALAGSGIAEEQVARIQQSGSPIATVSPSMAAEWGLSPDTLVVTGTNDQYAGALGAGNSRPGIVTETTGTCLALVTLTEALPASMPDGLFGGRFPIPRYQFALAYTKTAGLVLQWFSREFAPSMSLRELDGLATVSPIGSNGITMLPHFDGMVSPTPVSDARGCFANLTLGHSLGDLYRSILEALSFSLRENIDLLTEHGFRLDTVRAIGGGAKSDFWLQMKADVIGLPVEKPAVTEAATLGAAMLAAVGRGDFPSTEDSASALYRADRVFLPDADRHAQYEQPYQAYRELCRSMYKKHSPCC